MSKPDDRTGEVWECGVAIHLVFGPPAREGGGAWYHPTLLLNGENRIGEVVGIVETSQWLLEESDAWRRLA